LSVAGLPEFDSDVDRQSTQRPDSTLRAGIIGKDQIMKMFTSGTTGMPKAAKVTHVRAQNYCALMKGGAVIVRPKFSASKFWDDAVKYKATLFMYVGELCRFLLSAPPHPNERKHNIRYIIGNGLREEVWRSFVARFDIPSVIEFYGATEGNVSLINLNGRIGAMGRVPAYLKSRFNIEIVAHDVESGTIPRGSDGFCILAAHGETGEFRWKAENVATGEVAAVLSQNPNIVQANVYGVKVPGTDGRAGMASIVSSGDLDLQKLHADVTAALPHYARPVFLRIGEETDTTGTFKFKKTNLVKAGFDPKNTNDALWVASPISGAYEPIDAAMFEKIMNGDLRL